MVLNPMPKLNDLTGQKFGRLTVRGRAPNRDKRVRWICVCDCGKVRTVLAWHLTQGDTQSCGCLRDEIVSKCNRTHGATQTVEYQAWNKLRRRCTNPNDIAFPLYGGRGIKVCERWDSFENFIADMGKRPSAKHSIDRIDCDGDYCPENCRWATPRQQQGNRRFCYRIRHNGRTFNLAALARETGVRHSLLRSRIRSRGIKQKEFASDMIL